MIKKKKSISKYLIYTGNHRTIYGISEYLQYFKRLNNPKLNFVISNKLDLKKNYSGIIVIEEFTNYKKFKALNFFLEKFKGKKILVMTEFIKNNSFNNFSNYKSDFLKFIFQNYKIFYPIIFLSKLSTYILKKYFFNLFNNNIKNKLMHYELKLSDFSYFYLRYLQYLNIYKKFDFFFTSHEKIKLPNIKKNKIFILDYYVYVNKKNLKSNFLEKKTFFSGQLNNHRLNYLKKFLLKNKYFNVNSIEQIIKSNENSNLTKFIDIDSRKYNFSLYIPKLTDWKYSSPSRHIRDLRNNTIPISTNIFYDNYSLMILNIKKIFIKTRLNEKVFQKYYNSLRQFNKKEIFKG